MRAVLILFISMTLLSVLWRILPHEWNMTPFMALALLAGARLPNGAARYLLPLGGMLVADFFLGFHATMPWVYGTMLAVIGLGSLISQRALPWYLGGAVAGSLLFFVVTNFGVWAVTDLYASSPAGLAACYVAALPFLIKSMAADLFFTVAGYAAFAVLGAWQRRASAERATA